ncbi:unnamed protein product [Protopolystoma xenopodis]|uniref:Uncharacterized protein n=1 Tax=Protopolystoma xenopodis TaxID=117903 RepID=A0A3S5A2S4_9PLAT|nr:unnamed protein product [Protopolystoma xenopodis]
MLFQFFIFKFENSYSTGFGSARGRDPDPASILATNLSDLIPDQVEMGHSHYQQQANGMTISSFASLSSVSAQSSMQSGTYQCPISLAAPGIVTASFTSASTSSQAGATSISTGECCEGTGVIFPTHLNRRPPDLIQSQASASLPLSLPVSISASCGVAGSCEPSPAGSLTTCTGLGSGNFSVSASVASSGLNVNHSAQLRIKRRSLLLMLNMGTGLGTALSPSQTGSPSHLSICSSTGFSSTLNTTPLAVNSFSTTVTSSAPFAATSTSCNQYTDSTGRPLSHFGLMSTIEASSLGSPLPTSESGFWTEIRPSGFVSLKSDLSHARLETYSDRQLSPRLNSNCHGVTVAPVGAPSSPSCSNTVNFQDDALGQTANRCISSSSGRLSVRDTAAFLNCVSPTTSSGSVKKPRTFVGIPKTRCRVQPCTNCKFDISVF